MLEHTKNIEKALHHAAHWEFSSENLIFVGNLLVLYINFLYADQETEVKEK